MRLLVVQAPYYEDISNYLKDGAQAALDAQGTQGEFIEVKGALEIPSAIKICARDKKYDGFVALGCVIRGETSHYETVSHLSAQGLMELGVRDGLAIGNGILTVENKAQALERSDPNKGNKGGFAVEACLALLTLKQ